MVEPLFASILKDLEHLFGFPLVPDAIDSCLVRLKDGMSVQMEFDRRGLFLIGCRLGTIPPSRYRDLLFAHALRENGHYFPSQGVLGFSQKSQQLILFLQLTPQGLNADRFASILPPFFQRAHDWHEALGRGDMPRTSMLPPTPERSSGMFGLTSQ